MQTLALPYEYIALLKLLKGKYFTIIITGRKKSGKSALMYHLAEMIKWLQPGLKAYIINFPPNMRHLLPSWIEPIPKERVDEVRDAIVLFEEASLVAFSRNWHTSYNKLLSQLMAISAHKKQRQIFVIQSMNMLDKNIISLADTVFVKPYSYIGYRIEREELRDVIAQAWMLYEKAGITTLEEQRKYAVAIDVPDAPMPFLYRYNLPTFWREELSYAWAGWTFRSQRREKTLTERVRELILQGKTLKEIQAAFPEAKPKSLQVIYYRTRSRLREEGYEV